MVQIQIGFKICVDAGILGIDGSRDWLSEVIEIQWNNCIGMDVYVKLSEKVSENEVLGSEILMQVIWVLGIDWICFRILSLTCRED